MKERPLIFNGEMVRAILDGRKTQTRRVISDRHLHLLDVASQVGECYPLESGIDHANSQSYYREHCPFGQVGDRLWVRETWSDVNLEGIPAVAYRADGDVFSPMDDESFLDEDGAFNYEDHRVTKYHFAAWYSDLIEGIEGVWRPSIHMPRWASRITLEINAVRVERLNSISDVEAMREGIQNLTTCSHADFGIPGVVNAQHPVRAFQLLWESIYGVDGWEANPWVWVIEFKRVEAQHG